MAAAGPALRDLPASLRERFAANYGFWRPVVEHSVKVFLKCGDLHEGFARVRCPDYHHEMFVAFRQVTVRCTGHPHPGRQNAFCVRVPVMSTDAWPP